MREAELDGGTLTEIEGKKLLQQLQEMATNKQCKLRVDVQSAYLFDKKYSNKI